MNVLVSGVLSRSVFLPQRSTMKLVLAGKTVTSKREPEKHETQLYGLSHCH